MAKEIKLPKLSEDADEGTVAEVMIKEGDTVEKDDSVIAVESDKATVEVPSEEAGTVKEVKVSEGDAIKTGDIIAVLEEEEGGEKDEEKEDSSEQDKEPDEEREEDKDGGSDEEEQESESDKEEESDEEKDEQEEKNEKQEVAEEDQDEEDNKSENDEETEDKEKDLREEEAGQDETDGGGEELEDSEEKKDSAKREVHSAPGAKRLAREHDINLIDIEGSGPDGLITAEDIRKVAGLDSDEKEAEKNTELPDFSKWGTVERKPLSEIRKATAKQTQSSWQTVPHVTQFDEADVSSIQEYIEQHQDEVEEQGGMLTITAVLTKVIANALHQFPKFNASIDMDAREVILKKYIHIGIAVDTDEGLLVPIVRDVDQKSIIELALEITELAERARNKELSGENMEGGNFIISNLGGIGGTQFTPVIFHPQVAILGVSEMTTKPVYNKETESFQPVLTLPLSLSYDHRLIDGAEGARFLRYMCNALEDPYKALLGE